MTSSGDCCALSPRHVSTLSSSAALPPASMARPAVPEVFGITCRCVTLPKLIALKRAAGRPRDFDAIAELEVLLEEQRRDEPKANE
ncbi:MAG: hypothetical protein HY655_07315 [Acidobacteria bacterium]|nr:hypothetical protein [Acidobacteriota bacterium]